MSVTIPEKQPVKVEKCARIQLQRTEIVKYHQQELNLCNGICDEREYKCKFKTVNNQDSQLI